MRRRDEPAWLHWGLGEGFRTQTRTSIVLGGLLAVFAFAGLAAIIIVRLT